MIRLFKKILEYCPHPPEKRGFNPLLLYYKNLWLTFQIRDFKSSIDGLVALVILYGLLFAISFLQLPIVGLMEHYILIILRVASVILLALGLVYIYAKSMGIQFLKLGISRAKQSIIESLFALLVWAALWLSIREATRTYFLVDMKRFIVLPLASLVGFMGSLVVCGYCTPKFVKGLGEMLGIFLSSIAGSLLLFAVSMDFALYLLPIIILLVYINVKTESALGPIIAITLLFSISYMDLVAPAWVIPIHQSIYWFMTTMSVISAVFAGLFLIRFLHPRLVRV